MSGENGLRWTDWPDEALATLRRGVVIPAHPLALNGKREIDARRQRGLARYYLDAGAGGLAVGVHTTQFAIRDVGLYTPVLEIAMGAAAEWATTPPVMIAGLAGRTEQAVGEARIARGLNYHAGLLSLAAMKGATEDELIAHAETVAREIRLSVSICSRQLADSSCRSPSGGVLRRSTMSWRSKSRRSTAIELLTWCAASSRPALQSGSPSIPATTIILSPT